MHWDRATMCQHLTKLLGGMGMKVNFSGLTYVQYAGNLIHGEYANSTQTDQRNPGSAECF